MRVFRRKGQGPHPAPEGPTPFSSPENILRSASVNGQRRAMLRNVVASYSAFGVQFLIGIAFTPIILRGLGQRQFGLYTVLFSLAGYAGILELGLGTAILRQIARDATDSNASLVDVLRTSRFLYAVVSIGAAVIVGVVTLLLPRIVNDPPPGATLVLLAIGASQILGLLLSTYTAVLIGLGRSDAMSYLGLLFTLLTAGLQITAVLATHSYIWVAGVSIGLMVAHAFLTRAVAKRLVQLPNEEGKVSRPLARSLLLSGWRNAAVGIAATLAYGLDVVIVSSALGLAAAAAYGIATRASGSLLSFTSRASETLVPTYAHHAALGERERLQRLYQESVNAAWIFALPLGIFVIAAAPDLLHFWLGSVPPGTAGVLRVLVITALVAVPGSNAFKFLSGTNDLSRVVFISLGTAVVNLGLGLVLVRTVGVTGPALATLVTSLIYDCVLMPRLVARACGIPGTALLREWTWLVPPSMVATSVAVSTGIWGGNFFVVVGRGLLIGSGFVAVATVSMGVERRARYGGLLRTRRGPTPVSS